MDCLMIEGGNRLEGSVRVSAAKNAVLPILAACMLTKKRVLLRNCPRLLDVENMLAVLRHLGCECARHGKTIEVNAAPAAGWEMPDDLSGKLRSSIFLMGPLLGRFGRARIAYPGGCDIGLRPIDLHLKGLRALGARIVEEGGEINCFADELTGADVWLDLPSVGATENIMMAAVFARGKTIIRNAAREPEIADLAAFINAMGGRIRGAGTDTVYVESVTALGGCEFSPMPDRIIAGTLLAAAAATRGEIELTNVHPEDMASPLHKLRAMGCDVCMQSESVLLRANGKLRCFEISTQPYPGFPTDLQAQFGALACCAGGVSVITENMFENRFGYAAQLKRMGARITVKDRTAIIYSSELTGAQVTATDLRGGAALAVAALAAKGTTQIFGAELIDRGYEKLENTFCALGARAWRVNT